MSVLKKISISLIIVLIALIGVLAYITHKTPKPVQTTSQAIIETPKPPEYVLDAYITQLADEVGLDKQILIKAHTGVSPTLACDNSPTTYGCFSSNTITLRDTVKQKDRYKQRVALTHEYLHWVYYNKNIQLKPLLLQVYTQNKGYFDSRFRSYYANGMKIGDDNFYSELHSFIGTEVSDSKLPPELLEHYLKYTKNRNALPSYI